MKLLLQLAAILISLASGQVLAQQSQTFGDYVVHYNALNTSLLTPQVAQNYGIQRSPSRALLNITVLRVRETGENQPARAGIEASATNLTGQRREIEMQEISDVEGGIYYIGVMRVHNLETFDFSVEVTPEGTTESFAVKFRQQFYTE